MKKRDAVSDFDLQLAPITLTPSPFPRAMYEKATRIQKDMNTLTARLATDPQLLYKLLGPMAEKEPFVKTLVQISKKAREIGGDKQRGVLGLLRSDYMVDQGTDLKIIEWNTIASSIGPLCDRLKGMHKYLID